MERRLRLDLRFVPQNRTEMIVGRDGWCEPLFRPCTARPWGAVAARAENECAMNNGPARPLSDDPQHEGLVAVEVKARQIRVDSRHVPRGDHCGGGIQDCQPRYQATGEIVLRADPECSPNQRLQVGIEHLDGRGV